MQKKKTYRSKKYMDFVKGLECCVDSACRHSLDGPICDPDSIPHHTETGGVGMKGSDLSCIPLCNYHHNYIHQHGKGTFQRKYDVLIIYVLNNTHQAYIEHLEGKK